MAKLGQIQALTAQPWGCLQAAWHKNKKIISMQQQIFVIFEQWTHRGSRGELMLATTRTAGRQAGRVLLYSPKLSENCAATGSCVPWATIDWLSASCCWFLGLLFVNWLHTLHTLRRLENANNAPNETEK